MIKIPESREDDSHSMSGEENNNFKSARHLQRCNKDLLEYRREATPSNANERCFDTH